MRSLFESLTDGLTLSDYDDWLVFDARLSELVRTRRARPVPALKVLHMPDEEWYVDPPTGEVYVYVRPDDKVLPKWERVNVFANPEEQNTRETSIGAIPVGNLDSTRAESIKAMLDMLVRQEEIETVDVGSQSAFTEQLCGKETWYKDRATGIVYRLMEAETSGENRWERVPLVQRNVGIQ